jgi:nodulation protein E
MRRVVITGVGVISSLGLNRDEFWGSLAEGRSGIGPVQEFEYGQLRIKNVAAVSGFDPQAHFPDKSVGFLDRFAQFAVVTAREAVAQAGVQWTPELLETTPVVTGACVGGRTLEESGYWELFHNARNRVHPLIIPTSMCNAGASHISMELGVQGPVFTFSTACSSSAHAIGHAFWMVRSGAASLAITGGSEAPLYFGSLKAWEAMRVVSPDTCRPFSVDRAGMILGEGGAVLVLEEMESAIQRGARPIAEIVGFGMSSDASHITQPAAQGAARAMRAALRDGGLKPEEIGYINAHGTGTEANDRMESAAIRAVFGEHASRLAVSSTKSMHGHTLGAAGAIEAAATAMALDNRLLPPTMNFTQPDPDCDLDFIANQPRQAAPIAALSNSFAFGGLNAVLAFRAMER